MNRVRKIQLFLLIVMLVLIAIVIGNFNRGRIQESIKTPDIKPASQPIVSSGTRMEGGVHVLYRDGSPYATVHFKEAIQEKDRVHLSSPVLQITGIQGKVTADSAVVQGNVVVLAGKIILSSSKDDISVTLAPPATLQDGILTGMDTFEVKMENGVFVGKGYELRIAGNELIGKTHAQFISSRESFSIQSKTGIANLKEKTLTFVQQVRLTLTENTEFETTTDAAFLNTDTERLSLVGRGKIKLSPLLVVRFSEATLWHQGGRWNGIFPAPLILMDNGKLTKFPNAVLRSDKFSFPWSIVQSKELFATTGPGSYSFQTSKMNAKAPIGRHNGAKITGTYVSGSYSGKESSVRFPEIQIKGLGRVNGVHGALKQNGNFEMAGNIYGELQNRQFLSDFAVMEKNAIQLKNAIIWDENTQSFSSAGIMKLSKKLFSATGHYEMRSLRGKGQSPLSLSSENAMGSEDGPSYLFGNVQTRMEGLTVNAPQAYVYKWGAVFFDADFTGPQVRKGHADLLIVVEKQHVIWMLGNADVTDKGGNRIKGHKLTLSTITGRISVYSGKKKVRIKLAL